MADDESPISFLSKEIQDLTLEHDISVDPSSGSANISVNVPLTPGRSGFNPALSLSYSSSSSNSIFGIGWGLSGLSSIGLSLKNGLPKYDGTEQYAFGGIELVPWLKKEGDSWNPRIVDKDVYWVHFYRSKIDQSYTRFEKWVHKSTRKIHWRIRDRENTVSIFGWKESGESRISDPENESRIYQWLLEAQYDKQGNAIHYEYVPENRENVQTNSTFEINRTKKTDKQAQRYLKRIYYGNTLPLDASSPAPSSNQWLFEVVFDYGEHEGAIFPSYESLQPWGARHDPYSSFNAGFEIRYYRLCKKIHMFHHFSELGSDPTLIGSLELDYKEDVVASTLQQIRYDGYRRDTQTGSYSTKSLTPLKFDYSKPEVGRSFLSAPKESHENTPYGIGGLNYRWIDLYGEGLPGILFENNQAWYYKANLGQGKLEQQHKVLDKPSTSLGNYTISDFDSDGNLNLVVLEGSQSGYYEYDRDGGEWQGFKPFPAAPHVEALGGHTQLLDLNGDGRADVVTIKQDRIAWYPSKGKEGFDTPVEISRPRTNGVTQAPTIGTDLNLDYFFADMSGDGLPDQVRIINGRVEYWPQLGNGHFSNGIVMENSPTLDFDGEFDASRVRLVDLDGSGTSDILYIGRGEIKYWINASGNRFIEGHTIKGLPYIDNISSVAVLDFLGDGTSCLVWSTALPGQAHDPIKYLQLTNGIRPRLLESLDNSMGKEVKLTYSNSSSHYLRDKSEGREWLTKLPQHSTVVDRLEVIDHIGNTRFQSLYEYHDGFYDGEERQFRGFGMVDQFDSDTYQGSSTAPQTEHTDPVCVRTWFHTGTPEWHTKRDQNYYKGDSKGAILSPHKTESQSEFHADELTDAFTSLAGSVLRTEVYGLKKEGKRKEHPYEVNQTSYFIRRLQPKTDNHDGCFTSFESETLNYLYEQNPDDPRASHQFTLSVDELGNVNKTCSIAYPRRSSMSAETDMQKELHISVAEGGMLNIDDDDRYEPGLPLESKVYEIAGIGLPDDSVFTRETILSELENADQSPLSYEQPFTGIPQSRLMQWNRNYYWNESRANTLPWGEIGSESLIHHLETACFNDNQINDVFDGRVDSPLLKKSGYAYKDDYWWQSSAILHYLNPDGFFLLFKEEAPEQGLTTYSYDSYHQALLQVTDALDNRIKADIDYHWLAPEKITDLNDNLTEVRYDPLGIIVTSTSQGENLSSTGATELHGNDLLSLYQEKVQTFDQVIGNPQDYVQGASQFYFYDLEIWNKEQSPLRSLSLVREQFVHDGEGGTNPDSRIQVSIAYIDGFGRSLQIKEKVDPGLAIVRDSSGNISVINEEPELEETDTRWRTSGHTVFNNKQDVIRQYEPFYTSSHEFESDKLLETLGETSVSYFDPLGRELKTGLPNGTETRVELTAWETKQYDPNDAIEGTEYETTREVLPNTDQERVALRKAQAHKDTPTILNLDPLGREVLLVETDNQGNVRRTETKLDFFDQPIEIIDPRGLKAFTNHYDMSGRLLHEQSIDAGEKWTLGNALDQLVQLWDSMETHQVIDYDLLGRIIKVHVNSSRLDLDHDTERMVYGDDPGIQNAKLLNARGQLVQYKDQAGILNYQQFDLIGNLLQSDRQLVSDYKKEPNWDGANSVAMDDPVYQTRQSYDALGQALHQSLPDQTTREFDYLQGGGLKQIRVSTEDGQMTNQPFLKSVDYNARGQRVKAILGNDVELSYQYEIKTYRMKRLLAKRSTGGGAGANKTYQDIRYTYDPVGNITHTIDMAQQSQSDVIHNLTASSDNEFTYDAFYQLIEAKGRVHQALLQNDFDPKAAGVVKGTRHINLNNGAAIERYTRKYEYDLSGNIKTIAHNGLSRNWKREIWTSATSNRSLMKKDLNGNDITNPESRFDENGNCLHLPHLHSFKWNYRNNLSQAIIIERANQADDAEFYVYGGDQQRVRKVLEKQLGNGDIEITEKIYLDGCEIKRIKRNNNISLERKTSHITDGSDRIALLHQWSKDLRGLETDNINQKKIHYQLSNHLGSSSLELNDQGDLISYEEYFPFGGTAFIAGDNLKDIHLKDYRYTGKERDDATGLYYYGYRYYAVWIGNWLSPDPIGIEDGLNLYQFTQNNPVKLVDDEGLQSKLREIVLPRNKLWKVAPTFGLLNTTGDTVGVKDGSLEKHLANGGLIYIDIKSGINGFYPHRIFQNLSEYGDWKDNNRGAEGIVFSASNITIHNFDDDEIITPDRKPNNNNKEQNSHNSDESEEQKKITQEDKINPDNKEEDHIVRPYGDNEHANAAAGLVSGFFSGTIDAYNKEGGGGLGFLSVIDSNNPFSGLLSAFKEGYNKEGGGGLGVLGALKSVNPFNTLSDQFSKEYNKNGGGLYGVLTAADKLNPLATTRDGLGKTVEAIKKGDANTAGKEFGTALKLSAQIVAGMLVPKGVKRTNNVGDTGSKRISSKGDGVKKQLVKAYSKVRSAALQRKFRRYVAKALKENPNHPLKFLLDEDGKLHKRIKRKNDRGIYGERNQTLVMEAGHETSAKWLRDVDDLSPLDKERFAIQSRYRNQMSNRATESKGGAVRHAIHDVEGLPVERTTLDDFYDFELITKEVYEKALSKRINGWDSY